MPTKPKRPILTTVEESEQSLVYPFTEEEYRKGIVTLNNNKAAGIDDVGEGGVSWRIVSSIYHIFNDNYLYSTN